MVKYELYKTDLKYKDIRNIDVNNVEWTEDVTKEIYTKTNYDALESRIINCKNDNYEVLDLNYMKLYQYPNISINVEMLKYLFVTNNKIKEFPALTNYKNLKVIDVSDNEISKKLYLPKSLIELKCTNNKIVELPSTEECPHLERLDCENNLITNIPKYDNLKILNCSKNNLKELNIYEKIKKINCEDNESLNYLPSYAKLMELIMNNTNIHKLEKHPELSYLQMYKTPIVNLPFMSKLNEVEADMSLENIDKQYVANGCKIKKTINKKLYIRFGK
jgi:hypothetical protein